MQFSEAEIQVLASLQRADLEDTPTDRATLDEGGARYWIFREDWSGAWDSLLTKGLIAGDANGYQLTVAGRPEAEHFYAERPDHFWYYYQHFYPRADASKAHSQLCERVFGADHCQEGQTDMACFDDLLDFLQLKPGDTLLDLGCGAGGLAEYASDRTGAHVTGIDYSVSAVDTANARTATKRDRVNFLQADMNTLAMPPGSFDAAFSLDTLYWLADVEQSLADIVRLLKPGGRLGIFVAVPLADCDGPEELEADATWVATALNALDRPYSVHDYTEPFLSFWPRMKAVVEELRPVFAAEGNDFICEALLKDADEDYLPAAADDGLKRYLYIVRKP